MRLTDGAEGDAAAAAAPAASTHEWVNEEFLPHEPRAALARLRGGLRVLVIPMEDASLSHLRVTINTGQDHEVRPGMREVSHFVEHMNGLWTSDEHPDSAALTLATSLRGMSSNASVTADLTTYWVTCQPGDLAHFARVLLRSLVRFRLDRAVFEQERTAVQEELRGMLSDPFSEMHARLARAHFGDHPRATSLRQQLDNVERLGEADLLSYRRDHYRAGGMVLAVAGRLEDAQLAETLRCLTEHLPRAGPVPPFPPPRSRSACRPSAPGPRTGWGSASARGCGRAAPSLWRCAWPSWCWPAASTPG